jgi:hypothetical protein
LDENAILHPIISNSILYTNFKTNNHIDNDLEILKFIKVSFLP